MNKPIRTISIFCLLLFVALMINATWLQYWKSEAYDKDGRNRRVIEAAYSRDRGAILVGQCERQSTGNKKQLHAADAIECEVAQC